MKRITTAILSAVWLMANATAWGQPQTSTKSHPHGPGAFANVEGGKIYYEECGSGSRTVVLIHDGIAHSAVWDDVWPAFCQKFHAIRYDRRGYGRSPAATAWYYETDDLVAVLRHLKVSSAILVGSSHGGSLSINFTLEHPQMVPQLVLVGAVVSGFPYTDHFLTRGTQNPRLFETNDPAVLLSIWEKDKYVMSPGNDAAKKRLLELLRSNPQDMAHADFPQENKPALPRLHEIRVPTLILTGDADIPDVHAHAGAIEAGILGSRRMVINDVGHLMYMEKPDEFSRVVIGFIEANSH